MVTRVISGGQAGCDQMALKIACELGIKMGGVAPKGWRTEDGPAPWLRDLGLTQSASADYSVRTKENVRNADATLILGHHSTGSVETMECALELKKPWRWVKPSQTTPESLIYIVKWLQQIDVRTLNVAGNRESVLKEKGGKAEIKKFLHDLLTQCGEES